MGWIHLTSWALYTIIESLQSINSQKVPPFRLSHIFLLSILSVVPGIWHVFGFILITRDLGRNIYIWRRERTTSYDVTWTCIWPYRQVKIYWVLRGHIFLSRITSWRSTFSKVRLVSDSSRRDLSKEPIKSWGWCKITLDLIMSSRSGP